MALAVHAQSRLVATGTSAGAVELRSFDGALLARRALHATAVRFVAFVEDDNGEATAVVSAANEREIVFSDRALSDAQRVALPSAPRFLAAQPRSARVAIAFAEGPVGTITREAALRPWSAIDSASVTSLVSLSDERFVLTSQEQITLVDSSGNILAKHSAYGLTSDELNGCFAVAHPNRERVVVVVDGTAMCLYTTTDIAVLDPVTGATDRGPDERHQYETWWFDSAGKQVVFSPSKAPGDGVFARIFAGNTKVLRCAPASGATLFTIDMDRALRRWDLDVTPSPVAIAGRFVAHADRVPDELCTWDRELGTIHQWSASDGSHRASVRHKPLHHETLALLPSGDVIACTAPHDVSAYAVIERWSPSSQRAVWSADGTFETPRAATMSPSAKHSALVATRYTLVVRDDDSWSDRETPHRTWGGAAKIGKSRKHGKSVIVSFDRSGLIAGWSREHSGPVWTRHLDGAPCAICATDDGRSAAILVEHGAAGLDLYWLDARDGAVLDRRVGARAGLSLSLIARADGAVVSQGVPPAVFDRARPEPRVVSAAPRGYCVMAHHEGRYALWQGFDGQRAVLDIEHNTFTPLDDCQGDATYQFASVSRGDERAPAIAVTTKAAKGAEVALVDLRSATIVARATLFEQGIDGIEADASRALLRVRSRSSVLFVRADDLSPSSLETPERAFEKHATDRVALHPSHVLHVFDTRAGALVDRAPVDERWAQRTTLSEDGRFALVVGAVDARLVDVRARTQRTLDARWARSAHAAFDRDDRLVIVHDELRVLDPSTAECVLAVRVAGDGARCTHFTLAAGSSSVPSSCAIALAHDDAPSRRYSLSMRSLDDGHERFSIDLGTAAVTAISLRDDRLAACTADGAVRVFDARDGAERDRFDSVECAVDALLLRDGRVAIIDAAGQLAVLAESDGR